MNFLINIYKKQQIFNKTPTKSTSSATILRIFSNKSVPSSVFQQIFSSVARIFDSVHSEKCRIFTELCSKLWEISWRKPCAMISWISSVFPLAMDPKILKISAFCAFSRDFCSIARLRNESPSKERKDFVIIARFSG